MQTIAPRFRVADTPSPIIEPQTHSHTCDDCGIEVWCKDLHSGGISWLRFLCSRFPPHEGCFEQWLRSEGVKW
jgi:hypothetical protein